jgi:hypothetical protein
MIRRLHNSDREPGGTINTVSGEKWFFCVGKEEDVNETGKCIT